MKTKFSKINILSCLLIISISFGIYLNTLDNTFLWDDELWIENNNYVKNFKYLDEIFTKDILSQVGRDFNYYRPVQALSLMIDYKNFGLNPLGYHLTNIIIHTLVGLSLFYLLNLLFKTKSLSLIASLLFIVHPIHAGAVSYISGRADPLCALFLIISFMLYIKFKEIKNKSLYIFSFFFFIIALLSKEIALIYPVFLYIYDYTTRSFEKEQKFKFYLPFLILIPCYLALRVFILDIPLGLISTKVSLIDRMPAVFAALTDYLRLFIFPFNLHLEYKYPMVNYLSLNVILGLLIIVLSLIYAFKARHKNTIISFSIMWFFIFFIPVSGIYPLGVYMAEHWMYLPSIGFFLILAYMITQIIRKGTLFRFFGLSLVVFLLGYFSILTIKQNDNYWQDAMTFYKKTIELSPLSFMAHNNLANVYYDMGLYKKAEGEYYEALKIKPDFTFAYHNLGLVYYEMGLYDKAIEKYQKAIQLKSNYIQAYNNLGNAYFRMGLCKEAKDSYEKVLKLDPDYIKALNNLALVYYKEGKAQRAKRLWLKVLRIDPNYKPASNNLKTFFKTNN